MHSYTLVEREDSNLGRRGYQQGGSSGRVLRRLSVLCVSVVFFIQSQSAFFQQMESRLKPLAQLEEFLDSNKIIFRYNYKVHTFSAIQADYLLQNDFEGQPVYLFLAQRTGDNTQVCRTFFPKSEKDYAQGQPQYTLLKKEKINQKTGDIIIQYDRLTPKEIKKE